MGRAQYNITVQCGHTLPKLLQERRKREAKQRGWVSPWAQMCVHTAAGAPASQLARGKTAPISDYGGNNALYPQENEA